MKRKLWYGLILFPCFASAQLRPSSNIVITPYKTTMIADGIDTAVIMIRLEDRLGKVITDSPHVIRIRVTGDAHLVNNGTDSVFSGQLSEGQLRVVLQAGTENGTVKLFASADSLRSVNTEIHTIHPGTPHPVTTGSPIAGNTRISEKVIGADISFLPQLEARGLTFHDQAGHVSDPFTILKAHGFNYIRLRIFDHPEATHGYAPGKGFCNLAYTEAMAKRIKAAGMKFLLDIHYSDYWADPQQQNKPSAWSNLDFSTLKDSVYTYTKSILEALKDQGTMPDMVQVGNEINHGILWPDGAINNLDSLAQLLFAGIKGVKAVSPTTPIMLHIALGGQNAEARFFVDNMLARKVPFDVIGLSYYPTWHGTPDDLKNNMADLATRYHKYVMVAEYAQLRQEVNEIAFTAPGKEALGTFTWEPLGAFFSKEGTIMPALELYPAIAAQYLTH